jgi:hypothetical protein
MHDRWGGLSDGDVEEWNTADFMRSMLSTEEGMSLGPGGHNGASGSECAEAGI